MEMMILRGGALWDSSFGAWGPEGRGKEAPLEWRKGCLSLLLLTDSQPAIRGVPLTRMISYPRVSRGGEGGVGDDAWGRNRLKLSQPPSSSRHKAAKGLIVSGGGEGAVS